MWKNLSHPNVLDLIGVPDTIEDGRLSMVSEWMANGDITGYVRENAGNHLKLVRHIAFSFAEYSAPSSSRTPWKDWNIFTTRTLHTAT